MADFNMAFPSPCGEMGMKNRKTRFCKRRGLNDTVSVPLRGNGYEKQRRMERLRAKREAALFPSPCGEMGMKNDGEELGRKDRQQGVSVPLRGNGYEKQT